MGAWNFVDRRIESGAGRGSTSRASAPRYVGRPEAAATATGLLKRHNAEQARLVASRRCQRLSAEGGAMATEIKVPTLGESVTEATRRALAQAGRRRGRDGRSAGRARNRQGDARSQRAGRRHA